MSGTRSIHSGEDRLLAAIDRHFPRMTDARIDDCAVLDAPSPQLISTDVFFEDVHFRRHYFMPEEIGHKALAVNISDIAAMGGRPLFFSLGLGLPSGLAHLPDKSPEAGFFDALCRGMARLAAKHEISLIGGDLSAAPGLLLSITIQGTPWQEDDGLVSGVLRRGVAQPGDLIFCIGPLGLARVGLAQLEAFGREALLACPRACAAHLMPEPLVQYGRLLARTARVEDLRLGLMDVSDGLARDLPRLLGPGLGATVRSAWVPVPDEVAGHARTHGLDPVRECLLGGEDYALAGTCPPGDFGGLPPALAGLPGIRVVGTVTENPGIFLDDRPFEAEGFDHFRSSV